MDTESDVIYWKDKEEIILKVRGIKKYFPVRKGVFRKVSGWIRAVDGVDLDIAKGKTLGIVGESGCGKSTLAKLILMLIKPDSGKIIFEGRQIQDLSEKELKPIRRKMQIIFQDPFSSLNPRLTAAQTIEEGLEILGIPRSERRKRIEEILELVGISKKDADKYPHQFSGGQRQRIVIARALSVNPVFIVCDEPVSALDVSVQAQIINLLRQLQEELGITYLFISHDINLVGYMSDMIAVMYLGKILEIGETEEVLKNPLHPYTKILLSSVLEPDPRKRKRFSVKGEVDSGDIGSGCKFQRRCELFETDCLQEIPLKRAKENHWVRCIKTKVT